MMIKQSWKQIYLDEAIKKSEIQLGRGNIISSIDITSHPGQYPIYSSSAKGNGEFGRYAYFMFDEELITWSIDGGGRFFYRPKHKFSITNVCGYLRVELSKWNLLFLYYLLDFQHQKIAFDYQTKAHPSVIKNLYYLLEISTQEQKQIADILSTIDRAIAQTEAIITKQQRIKTGLMQDLLTKGIDEHGNIRSEATHEFKDSAIGRIPVEWEVSTLDKVADILDPNPSHRNPIYIEYGYPFISTVEFIEPDKIEINTSRRVSEETVLEQEKRCLFNSNSIAFSRKGTIGKIRILPSGLRFALLDSLCVINAKQGINSHFIYQMLRSYILKQQIDSATMGVALPQMSIGRVRTLLIPVPNNEQEQSNIVKQISLISMYEIKLWHELTKINRLKTGLMQDLLTGKVRVTELLKERDKIG